MGNDPAVMAPGQAVNVAAGQGETKVGENQPVSPEQLVLEKIRGKVNREFKSLDDVAEFVQHYDSRIGDQALAENRKKADAFDRFVDLWAKENKKSREYASAYINDYFTSQVDSPSSTISDGSVDPLVKSKLSSLEQEQQNLKMELQKRDLIVQYPESSAFMNDLVELAKIRNQPLTQVFENSGYKELVKLKRSQSQNQDTTVVPPTTRKGIEPDRLEQLKAQINKKDFTGFDDVTKQNLVREYFGAK